MNLGLLLHAPLPIQVHLATVLPAFAIGTWLVAASVKGSPVHRGLGAVYLVLMTVTAGAAAFIRSPGEGYFSPLHLLIPLTLYAVFSAVRCVRRGDIAGHRRAMLGLYVGGLVVAGTFAVLMPGRLLNRTLFG